LPFQQVGLRQSKSTGGWRLPYKTLWLDAVESQVAEDHVESLTPTWFLRDQVLELVLHNCLRIGRCSRSEIPVSLEENAVFRAAKH
jgi:hypothetical protein